MYWCFINLITNGCFNWWIQVRSQLESVVPFMVSIQILPVFAAVIGQFYTNKLVNNRSNCWFHDLAQHYDGSTCLADLEANNLWLLSTWRSITAQHFITGYHLWLFLKAYANTIFRLFTWIFSSVLIEISCSAAVTNLNYHFAFRILLLLSNLDEVVTFEAQHLLKKDVSNWIRAVRRLPTTTTNHKSFIQLKQNLWETLVRNYKNTEWSFGMFSDIFVSF